MLPQTERLRSPTTIAIVVGTLVSTFWLLISWRYGFDLADEGFYWYGAQRMLHGEMPMRDFMAYDIGRYVWAAAVMLATGDSGIVAARAAAGLFQVPTIVVGVVLALRACGERLSRPGQAAFAACLALVLNLWVHPYYKVFDYGTSILIVAMLFMMLTSVTPRRWFAAGLILGLAAIMGRNHGVYGALAALLLCGYLGVKQGSVRALVQPGLAFMAGTALGFSPTLVLFALVDGFAQAFIAIIVEMIQSGTTNIGLPVPWPWIHRPHLVGSVLQFSYIFRGVGFVAILLAPVLALIVLARRPLAQLGPAQALVLCCSFASLAYAHYAFSRADLTHLALAIAPLLLMMLCSGAWLRKATAVSVTVLLVSVITLAYEKPVLGQYVLVEAIDPLPVNGTDLYLYAPHADGMARRMAHVDQHLARHPGARDNFLIVPDSPGIYAIYGTRMPIWEIYALSARPAAFEARELARLQAASPKVIFVSDHALDGRMELRYSQLHPVLYQWIQANYRRVPEGRRQQLQVFVK